MACRSMAGFAYGRYRSRGYNISRNQSFSSLTSTPSNVAVCSFTVCSPSTQPLHQPTPMIRNLILAIKTTGHKIAGESPRCAKWPTTITPGAMRIIPSAAATPDCIPGIIG